VPFERIWELMRRLGILFLCLGSVWALSGCGTLSHFWPHWGLGKNEPAMPLEEYLARQQKINDRYLYGSPEEALRACQDELDLERAYAHEGSAAAHNDQAIMLAYARLYILSDRLGQRPEAEMYLKGALKYAKRWQPQVSGISRELQIAFIRGYLDDFEKGLEVRWKSELK
jgi:hypothetical protein